MIELIPSCLGQGGGFLPSATTVASQLNGDFFWSPFQVAQFTSVKRIVLLAFEQKAGWADFVAGASHLAPGFAVLFVPEMAGTVGRNIHLAAKRGDGNGNHVPEIFRNDISDDKVDFLGGIGRRAIEFDDVAGAVGAAGGLDLDAPELLAGVDDEVVALAVSPAFGDAKAKAGGFGEKSGLGSFAKRFACSETDGVDFWNRSGHEAFQGSRK